MSCIMTSSSLMPTRSSAFDINGHSLLAAISSEYALKILALYPVGDHERIFARFYTGCSRVTAARSGAGLGLSIARLVIERSGGQISFDETIMTGAKCIIDFPVAS